LRYYQEFVRKFLEAIRVCEHAHVQHIINMVKSGSSIEEIRVAVSHLLHQNTLTLSVPQHEREKHV
jgi:hypothetical protein